MKSVKKNLLEDNSRASQIVNDATEKAEVEAEKILSSASKTIENDVNKAKEKIVNELETIETIYKHAITRRYRFFSYGDSSLLFP